ncbi:MAG: hypothetical protein ACI9JM_003177 [Halioglobus sp.]|jgi:hypothetical protein
MLRIIAGILLLLPVLVNAEEWNFEVQPYLMATTISGENDIGRVEGAEVEMDMGDILEKLEIAGMIHGEVYNSGGWGVALDYAFMELGDDISGPREGVIAGKMRQGILQVDLFKRQAISNGTLDYIVGIRWWDIDVEASFDPAVLPGAVRTELEEDWVDVFIGARWLVPINDQWVFMLRADVGGFDLESDFTSLIEVGARYNINDNMLINMSYQGLWVDYDSGSSGPGHYANDTVTYGPKLGFTYQF